MVNGPHGTKVERKKILDFTLKTKKMVSGERGITMVKGITKGIIKMVKRTDLGRGGMIMGKKNIKAITIMVKKVENGLNGQVMES